MPDRMTMKSAPSTLVEGQRLDQPTFHALYQAMPPETRAELIECWAVPFHRVSRFMARSHRPHEERYAAASRGGRLGLRRARTCRVRRAAGRDPRVVLIAPFVIR